MKTKATAKLAVVLLILTLLLNVSAACGRRPDPIPADPDAAEEGAGEESTSPAEDEQEPSMPEGSETDHGEAGITELTCLDGAGTVTAVVAGPAGAAAVRIEPAGTDGRPAGIYRIDTVSDTVLARTGETDDPGFPIGFRGNGEVVTFDNERQVLRRYDSGLQMIQELPAAGSTACYSQTEDVVYLVREGDLVRLSMEGKEETVLSFRGQRYVECVDTEARTALVLDGAVNDQAMEAYMVYSFEGNRVFSHEASHGPYFLSDGLLSAMDYDGIPDDETGQKGSLLTYDPQNGWSVRAREISIMKAYRAVTGSPCICCTEHIGEEGGTEQTDVALLNVRTGEIFDLGSFEGKYETAAAFDREEGSLLVSVSSEEAIRLFKIDPQLLSASGVLKDAQILPTPEPEAFELPDHLTEAATLAAEIEEKYHVRVPMGHEIECAKTEDYAYRYTSSMAPEEEKRVVTRALEILDRALALYPEGFFDYFRNDDGEAGVRFLLVEDLPSEGSSFHAIGYTYLTGAWYNIALEADDITEPVVHHELWHAVESLAGVEGRAVGYFDWSQMNPEGYEYALDKETYLDQEYSEYILGNPDHEKVYFYSRYSTVNDTEDRATVIEALFSHGSVSEGYDFVRKYPHLLDKVRYLGELIRPVFGYVYWEEMIG